MRLKRNPRVRGALSVASVCMALACVPSVMAEPESVAEGVAFFEKRIRPLFIEHCYSCHSTESGKQKGGLLLDSRHGWERGGDSGPTLVPGKPGSSLLVEAVDYRNTDLQMPPKGRLPEAEIGLVRKWIALGAPDPRKEESAGSNPRKDSPEATPVDLESARRFWSFVPPRVVQPPATSVDAGAKEPIDAFVTAELEKHGLRPARPAGKRTLVRRAFFDLWGIPPSADQTASFLADASPEAFARLVDRLLASPRYGERWGRHWLDVARYSDSNGMDENMAYVYAYRYRDYVIDAFNTDKPYNTFIMEQIAGDLLADDGAGKERKREGAIATGFLSVGPKMLACDDPMKMRMDIVDEQIDTVGRAFMGLTLGCARCHDHKYDPITTADYYALAGIFKSTTTLVNYKVVAKWHEYDFSPAEEKKRRAELTTLEKRLNEEKKLSDEERAGLKEKIRGLKENLPEPDMVMGVTEGEPEDTRVHLRGNYLTLGEPVPRRIPSIFQGKNTAAMGTAQSGRLELARWMAHPDHPLTARVMVNRLWRWHFGRGIVPTTDNFGFLGALPANQALLDYLAVDFVDSGWSVKEIHRRIMNSSTYQRSTEFDPAAHAIDPENRYLWRRERRRLDAESLRDSLLALGGNLDGTMGGQLLEDTPGSYVKRGRIRDYFGIPRRSVYLPVIRSAVYDAFVAFDFADPSVINGDRRTSTVAPQALYVMNGPLVFETARHLAASALSVPGLEAEERIERLFAQVSGRTPDATELEDQLRFLTRYAEQSSESEAWEALCRVLLGTNAFVYVE